MANPFRGEVELIAGEKVWTLDLSMNGLCVLEEKLDKSVTEIAQDLTKPSARLLRTVLWAGLQEHHPGITEKEAGRIGGEVGLPAVVEAIGKAIGLSASGEAGDATATPPGSTPVPG